MAAAAPGSRGDPYWRVRGDALRPRTSHARLRCSSVPRWQDLYPLTKPGRRLGGGMSYATFLTMRGAPPRSLPACRGISWLGAGNHRGVRPRQDPHDHDARSCYASSEEAIRLDHKGINKRAAYRWDGRGNPKPSRHRHLRLCHCPPRLLAGARSVYPRANERYARTHGVKEVVRPKPRRVLHRKLG
jgi:hypothetical protein